MPANASESRASYAQETSAADDKPLTGCRQLEDSPVAALPPTRPLGGGGIDLALPEAAGPGQGTPA